MGCGSSTAQQAKGTQPENPRHQKEEKKISPRPVEGKVGNDNRADEGQQYEGQLTNPAEDFTFGEAAEDGSGTYKPDMQVTEGGKARRRTTLRRRGVSQEVDTIESNVKVKERKVVPKTEEQIARLNACLSTNPLFSALLPGEYSAVHDAMEEESFEQGVEILQQDEESTMKYYVIQEGEVDILRNGDSVARFGPGCGFGELELMYSPICSATVRSLTPVVCFSLDRATYRRIVMNVSLQRQERYRGFLKNVSFLKHASEYDINMVADSLEYCRFSKGDKLISFGSEGEWMFFIMTGKVRVMGKDDDGSFKEVATFGPGDTVGEQEFLYSHRCVADVIAETDGTACKLHRQHFERCLGPVRSFMEERIKSDEAYNYYNSNTETDQEGKVQFKAGFTFGDEEPEDKAVDDGTPVSPPPNIIRKKSSEAFRREAVFDHGAEEKYTPVPVPKSDEDRQVLEAVVSSHSLLKSLHEAEQAVIVDVLEQIPFKEGECILRQGDRGNDLLIITSGDAEVSRNGEIICTLSKGQSIGELELMYDRPCRASVTAKTDMITWRITRPAYKSIVMDGVTRRRGELMSLLRNVQILQECDDDRLMMIADALTEEKFAAGAKLLQHGETPDWMYIILDGVVDVTGRDTDGTTPVHVCSFERGSIVGELEFLNKHPTVADVVAKTDVTTGKLHRDHFDRVLGSIAEKLKKSTETTDYSYYNQKFEGFCFGEEAPEGEEAGAGDDDGDVPQPPPPTQAAAKRDAVSAEADEGAEVDFVPTVVEKTPEERASIEAVLDSNILFTALRGNREAVKVVVDAMEKVVYSKGDHILTQNDVGGEHWFIIEEGEVDIVKNGKTVASFDRGSGFGEMELMYSCRTAASVVAKSDTLVCWRLGRTTYRHIVMRASERKRRLCKEALNGVAWLKSMTAWQQDHLADALQPCSFDKGTCILKRQTTPDAIHIIIEGSCVVIAEDDTEICNLGYGELVGELEFLNQHAAVADVFAATDCSTLRLSQEHFELCLGPVKSFLHEVTQTDKYKYYREKRAENEAAAAGG